MDFMFCSRKKVQHFVSPTPWVAIQIATEPGDWPDIHADLVLRLAFADIDNIPKDLDIGTHVLFDESHADRILAFAQMTWPRYETLMVHCEAGISRSPAVAAALQHVFIGFGVEEFFCRAIPNRRVFTTILKRACDQGIGTFDPIRTERSDAGAV